MNCHFFADITNYLLNEEILGMSIFALRGVQKYFKWLTLFFSLNYKKFDNFAKEFKMSLKLFLSALRLKLKLGAFREKPHNSPFLITI